jgi:hypothetical protein
MKVVNLLKSFFFFVDFQVSHERRKTDLTLLLKTFSFVSMDISLALHTGYN